MGSNRPRPMLPPWKKSLRECSFGIRWRRGRRGCLRGRRGTGRRPPTFCMAGVALGDMDAHFAWQAWHLWHWAGSGGALGSQLTPCLRGRRGTWRHPPPLCVTERHRGAGELRILKQHKGKKLWRGQRGETYI